MDDSQTLRQTEEEKRKKKIEDLLNIWKHPDPYMAYFPKI